MDWITPELVATAVAVIVPVLTAIASAFGWNLAKYKKAMMQTGEALSDGNLTKRETVTIIKTLAEGATKKKIEEKNKDDK